jgi:hypothetical protein
MTVEAFEAALSSHSNARFAIVSETLFFLLDDQGKIECRTIEKGIPDKPGQIGPVRMLLREHVKKTDTALKLSFFVLKSRPQLHIDCVMLHGFHVDDTGPNSFVICGDITSQAVDWAGAATQPSGPSIENGAYGPGPIGPRS